MPQLFSFNLAAGLKRIGAQGFCTPSLAQSSVSEDRLFNSSLSGVADCSQQISATADRHPALTLASALDIDSLSYD
jgi:hypothetical protein